MRTDDYGVDQKREKGVLVRGIVLFEQRRRVLVAHGYVLSGCRAGEGEGQSGEAHDGYRRYVSPI